MTKTNVKNFLKKGLESCLRVHTFRTPFFQHPAPQTRAGRKKILESDRKLPKFSSKDFLEKVLTEQSKVRVVDIFPSWEGAL
jgi:hypothetical protein